MKDNFFLEGYEIPDNSDKYMKFEDGKNKFRILGSFENKMAIMGTEYWVTVDEKRKPRRLKLGVSVPVEELELDSWGNIETPKHFWVMPVWNYNLKKVQLLEITQKTIMSAIKNLARDEDWGFPLEYDLTITKTGEKLKTEYTVTPSPKKPFPPELYAGYMAMNININALYDGGDPFAANKSLSDMDMEEIDETLAGPGGHEEFEASKLI